MTAWRCSRRSASPHRPTRSSSSTPIRRICLAIGVRGLVNAQFIVRDDGVYLLEVNPRASRTVPFLSKVTGVSRWSRSATRVALGASTRRPGLAGRPARPAAARRGQGAGLLDHEAPRRGLLARAGHAVDRRGHRHPRGCRRGAGQGAAGGVAAAARSRRPTLTWALVSVADRDKPRLAELAERARGGRLPLRGDHRDGRGAARARPRGARGRPSRRRGRDRPADPRRHRERHASSSSSTRHRRGPAPSVDAAAIRHAAVAEGILCLTSHRHGRRGGALAGAGRPGTPRRRALAGSVDRVAASAVSDVRGRP